ncbi:AraC family transcriptional regulator [Leptospira yanagawae]|uniref:AraC family transcriptional regulator n=1 Tax=Leptospira yanagawae TaxID=293069 RepID=A0ABY2M268_9LEPT|nr:helix-turn-helix domain-containing protein [Leptospira yanagawae]TGL21722.1 AraC family transcriptional regulator [Leptospira yanagawae]
MNLIPIMGAVISSILAISYWIENFQKKSESKKTKIISTIKLSPPSILFFCLTLLQFHIYLEISNEMKAIPSFYGIHIPVLYLIGPVSYQFFEELSGQNSNQIRILHFLPFVLSILLLSILKSNGLLNPNLMFKNHEEVSTHDFIFLLLGIGVLSIFIYTLAIFIRVLRWKMQWKGSVESSFRPFVFLIMYSLFVLVLFVLAQWVYMDLFFPACFALTSLLFAIILLKLNGKGLLSNFKTEFREARYKESRVKGIDIPSVLERMDGLMNVDRLYLDDRLTLVSVAKRLDLSSHQLSEILNHKLGTSFRNYINQFRLLEAKKLLLERPDMAIIAIIYASGFNSKSSFHKLFQTHFGTSPQNYRSKVKEKMETKS